MERKVTLECYSLLGKFKDDFHYGFRRKPDTDDGYWVLWSKYNGTQRFHTKDGALSILNDWIKDGLTEYKVVHQIQEVIETDILFGKVDDKQEAKHELAF